MLSTLFNRLPMIFSRDREISAAGKPTVVISDAHIGTSMWQAATLAQLGVEVLVETLSDHAHYADGTKVSSSPLFKNLDAMPVQEVRKLFRRRRDLDEVKWAICSFPPSRVEALSKLPEEVRILVNVGHRLQIHVAPERIIEVTRLFEQLASDPRYILATMSEYDFHYVRYHTGHELKRLPVIASHAPAELREAPYGPSNRTVLIGPSHNTSVILGFNNDLADLNARSTAYARERGLEPFVFDFIKSIYPGDQATLRNLSRHPAVLMNPYSAFSISMVELYQINMPFFVPADELLVNRMGDVRLEPLYQPKSAVEALSGRYPADGTPYSYSPHDDSESAQRYWLKYMYFNQVKHAQRWATPEELFDLLYGQDLSKLHQRMQQENAELSSDQVQAWEALIAGR